MLCYTVLHNDIRPQISIAFGCCVFFCKGQVAHVDLLSLEGLDGGTLRRAAWGIVLQFGSRL